MKVIKAMKAHHSSIKSSLSNFGNSCIQSTVVDYVKPKSEMRERKLSDLEASQLIVKSDLFQAKGVLDERTFHFANVMEEYEDFVEYEQQKANQDISRHFYVSKKKPLLCMPNLTKMWMDALQWLWKSYVYLS